ncbi:hypothetical protein DPMN_062867 [Dreissena polymorpha]|uniref:Uncharacterized protein n=1 Tax=Dreissena polymorpha TaxID=45954 RepID=A0A9D4C9Y5_DREPO|nr:hypothetical protein DPMN_062867 [Dreissena polymorpha]
MANTTLVAADDRNTGRFFFDTPSTTQNTNPNTFRQRSSFRTTVGADRMQAVGASFRNRGFSTTATRVFIALWRTSTKREYKVYIRRWFLFCDKQQIDRFSVSIIKIIDFVTEEFQRGLGYSAMNTVLEDIL